MASGHETATDVALATAVRTDSWIIIENIHFASVPWLKQLYIRLARLRTQAGWCILHLVKYFCSEK